MRDHRRIVAVAAWCVIAASTAPWVGSAAPPAGETAATEAPVAIPESIQVEHDAIHAALIEATRAPGRVGAAAKELAAVLHPHFVREEEIALPPLAMLRPLAAGATIDDGVARDVLAMTDALRAELPRMLEEHGKIRAAVDALRRAAEAESAPEQVELAEQLALHARTEEEVLYPAALLAGELLRARRRDRAP